MIDKHYNPQKTEARIYRFWEKTGFFNPDKLPGKTKKPFVVLLPPPNITGTLHMGHTLNASIQDVIVRKKRMEGYKTLWIPGTDHAGIATQNAVEKNLKKRGLTRFDLGREKFEEAVWQWTKKYGGIILNQLKSLGASCDWSRKVFTLDKSYVKAVKEAFYKYWKEGLIYMADRPVNWCPRCQTSLSDIELEYQEHQGKLWFIKYPIGSSFSSKKQFLTVATTRPETLLGDTAVAVNPSDPRYKKLIGKTVIVPIVEREIPVVADLIVNPSFGTGAVKVTPAHDLKDYEIAQRHQLPMIQVINENAKIISPAPKSYQGLNVLEARKKIIQELEQRKLIAKIENYTIQIPKCYRCNTTVEIIPSRQWFLKMQPLAEKAKKAVRSGKIKIIPKGFKKIYFNWLNNIRDWCLSRQIWWGHRLPVWECQNKPGEWFVATKKPVKCPICRKCQPEQVTDVLDTWFSSALWPFATLGWPQKTKDLKRFYPSNVLVTARDIINFWVTRMIFSGLEFMGKEPFSTVFVNPTVLNKQGQRMSKSLGTGVDPMELIEKYGADATRFGLLWQTTGIQDIRFDEQNIVAGKKFANKIWNASRFVMFQLEQSRVSLNSKKPAPGKLSPADRKIIRRLEKTSFRVSKYIDSFKFGQALSEIYHFFWHQFCDIYIEKSKTQLQKAKTKSEKKQTLNVLGYVLLESLKLLHPFMPFVTEEIYQKLPLSAKSKKQSIMIEAWPR